MALGDPYITGPQLATFLKNTISADAPQLQAAAVAASRWIDGYCRRQFNLAIAATPRIFDVSTDGSLLVDDIGNTTITVATDTSLDGTYATTWLTTDVQAQPFSAISQGRPITSLAAVGSQRFPVVSRRAGLVKVTAIWGWPAVPTEVAQAAYIQAGHLYKRRESTEGVLGFGNFGPVRVGTRIDPDVEALLADVRLAQKPG